MVICVGGHGFPGAVWRVLLVLCRPLFGAADGGGWWPSVGVGCWQCSRGLANWCGLYSVSWWNWIYCYAAAAVDMLVIWYFARCQMELLCCCLIHCWNLLNRIKKLINFCVIYWFQREGNLRFIDSDKRRKAKKLFIFFKIQLFLLKSFLYIFYFSQINWCLNKKNIQLHYDNLRLLSVFLLEPIKKYVFLFILHNFTRLTLNRC